MRTAGIRKQVVSAERQPGLWPWGAYWIVLLSCGHKVPTRWNRGNIPKTAQCIACKAGEETR